MPLHVLGEVVVEHGAAQGAQIGVRTEVWRNQASNDIGEVQLVRVVHVLVGQQTGAGRGAQAKLVLHLVEIMRALVFGQDHNDRYLFLVFVCKAREARPKRSSGSPR